MNTINKLRKFYELKKIERACSVAQRKESSAEQFSDPSGLFPEYNEKTED